MYRILDDCFLILIEDLVTGGSKNLRIFARILSLSLNRLENRVALGWLSFS